MRVPSLALLLASLDVCSALAAAALPPRTISAPACAALSLCGVDRLLSPRRRLVLAAPPRVELEPQLRALRRPLGRLLVDPVDAGLLDVAVAAEGGGEREHGVAWFVLPR